MWSEDIAQAFTDATNWLTLCSTSGITLNPEKFVFAQDTVQFAGFEIGLTTVKPAVPSPNSLSLPPPLMVQTGEPGGLQLLPGRHHGTIQRPSQAIYQIRLDQRTSRGVRGFQARDCQADPDRSGDLRQRSHHMHCY